MKTAFVYNIFKRWTFVLAVVVLLVMNYLSNTLPFGGNSMAAMSEKYSTLLTPAGYAFSIWGVIYLTLAIFAFFQLTRGKEIRFYRLIWPWFIINVIANISWLIAFQNDWIGVSAILMLVVLGSLIGVMRLFYRLRNALSTTHRYFFQIPFSLYFGWISVAAMVNFAVFFTALDVAFFLNTPVLYAIILLIVGAGLSLYFLFAFKDYVFSIAVIWAYVAIWVASGEEPMVENAAKIIAIALAAAAAVHFVKDRIQINQYGNSTT